MTGVPRLGSGGVARLLPALPKALGVHLRSGDALRADAEAPVSWAVVGVLEHDTAALVVGQEDASFKTFAALDLGIARVVGGAWLGFDVVPEPRARVLVVAGEGRARHIVQRVRRLARGRGLDPDDVDRHFVVHPGPISMVPRAERDRVFHAAGLGTVATAERLVKPEDRQRLASKARPLADAAVRRLGEGLEALRAIEDAGPDVFALVVIDTVSHCLAGDENSAADARRFTRAIDDLAERLVCPVIAIHHPSRAADHSRARSSRGSSALEAGVRAVLRIDARGPWPILSVGKLNDHAKPEPRAYRLVDVEGDALRFELREGERAPRTTRLDGPDDGVMRRVLDFIASNPGTTTREIRRRVQGGNGPLSRALERLSLSGAIADCGTRGRSAWKVSEVCPK